MKSQLTWIDDVEIIARRTRHTDGFFIAERKKRDIRHSSTAGIRKAMLETIFKA